MKVIYRFTACTFLLLAAAFLSAQENPDISVEPATEQPQSASMPLYTPVSYMAFSAGYCFSDKKWNPSMMLVQGKYQFEDETKTIFAGAQLGDNGFNLTARFSYWPFRFDHIRIGVGGIYNLDFYSTISMTNNLLPGLFLDIRPLSWLEIQMDLFYLLKFRSIYSVMRVTPCLLMQSTSYNLSFLFRLPANFGFYVGIATLEDFRIVTLGYNIFSLGLSYQITEKWNVLLDLSLRAPDFPVLGGVYDETEIRVTGRYVL